MEKKPSMFNVIRRRRLGLAVAKGRGRMVIRASDGSTRELEYYSFNVFEKQDGRWVYSAAFLP